MSKCIYCGGTGFVARNSGLMGAHMIDDPSIQFELAEGIEVMKPCPHCSGPYIDETDAKRLRAGGDDAVQAATALVALAYANGLKAGTTAAKKAKELVGT